MAKLNNIVKQNSLRAWLLASRPKTLTAAAVPVMIAVALAWRRFGDSIDVISAILCFMFAMVMQIDANFVNDYYDCLRGNDDETRLGPLRACSQGWISLPAMRNALVVTTLLACIVGLPLAYIGGWTMILVGLACVLFCFLYTTTLSYLGLGDILVLVFFGIVPTCCTYYLVSGGSFTTDVLWISISVGLVIDTLLIVNNYRDIDNDRRSGKRTLAVLIGKKAMSAIYLMIVPLALLVQYIAIPEQFSYLSIALILLCHLTAWYSMVRIGEGRELNNVLGMTARNILWYGLLSTVDIVLMHI